MPVASWSQKSFFFFFPTSLKRPFKKRVSTNKMGTSVAINNITLPRPQPRLAPDDVGVVAKVQLKKKKVLQRLEQRSLQLQAIILPSKKGTTKVATIGLLIG